MSEGKGELDSPMVQRVAQAINDTYDCPGGTGEIVNLAEVARAAIEAMREPIDNTTKALLKRGAEAASRVAELEFELRAARYELENTQPQSS